MCDPEIGLMGKISATQGGPIRGVLRGAPFSRKIRSVVGENAKNGSEIGARETAVWESDIGVAKLVRRAQDCSRIKGGKVTRLSAW